MCNCNKSSGSSRTSTRQSAAPTNTSSPAFSTRRRSAIPRETSAPFAPEPPVEIEGETVQDKCRTFAYMLGLEEPVSREVLEAAIDNPGYARSLMSARDNAARLSDLLIHPPILLSSQPPNGFTNARLIAKASSALLKWAVAGFPTVSKSTLQKREDACLACPNLKEPTNRLQSMTASATASDKIGNRTGNKSCTVCGCVITNKIRLSTETCPVASQENPEVNRWGEQLKAEATEA